MSGPNSADLWQEVLAWLRVAESDGRADRLCLTRDPPLVGIAAFHCEQAAEKLLKGFLVQANTGFRRTHDLGAPAASVVARFPAVEKLASPMRRWTAWGAAYRYPTETKPEPEPSAVELNAALDLIERLATHLRSLAPGDQADRNNGSDSS